MTTIYTISLDVTVHDKQALRHAAEERANEEGCEYDLDDVGICLRVLLDPGTLPGCEIKESRADSNRFGDEDSDDFDDETEDLG